MSARVNLCHVRRACDELDKTLYDLSRVPDPTEDRGFRVELMQPLDEDSGECVVCGWSTRDDAQLADSVELPSMMGYGSDEMVRCRRCNARQSSTPLRGLERIHVDELGAVTAVAQRLAMVDEWARQHHDERERAQRELAAFTARAQQRADDTAASEQR